MGKRILYIGNALTMEGSTPTTIDVLGALLDSRHEVVIVSRKRRKFLRFTDMCLTLVKSRKGIDCVIIDVYSSSAFYFAVGTAGLCRLFGLPYITIAHGGNLPERVKISPKMAKKLFTSAYSCITPSDFLKDSLAKSGIDCHVIPNPIDIRLYPFRDEMVVPRILWVRSLHSIYNPEMALHTLSQLITDYPNASLTMVGPEKDISIKDLEKRAGDLGIRANVTFTGLLPKEEWILLASNFSFLINTSQVDNAPVSLVEAMALGLIVVSTNVGGIPYMVTPGENGFLVNDKDALAMAAVIAEVLKNKYDASEIRRNARQYAEKFDQGNVLEAWDKILTTI